MERVGKFEKVSYDQFYAAMKDGFNLEDHDISDMYDDIELPTRATSGSAGYDFKTPIGFILEPGKTIKVPTGIRVKIDSGWWLAALPRSGMGFKYRIQLDNTVGVVDEDYYGSSNEGHIFIKITNDTKENKTMRVGAGDSFIQAIFIPYGITYDDNVKTVRDGGMGSTGR